MLKNHFVYEGVDYGPNSKSIPADVLAVLLLKDQSIEAEKQAVRDAEAAQQEHARQEYDQRVAASEAAKPENRMAAMTAQYEQRKADSDAQIAELKAQIDQFQKASVQQ